MMLSTPTFGEHRETPIPGRRDKLRRGMRSCSLARSNLASHASRGFSRRLSGQALLATVLLAASAAAAPLNPSTDDKAAARSAAELGNTAFKEGRFAAALDLFKRAEAVVHAPTHLLMMARSNVALGHFLAAEVEYREITRDPLAKAGPAPFLAAEQAAENELIDLEVRVPTVDVRVTPAGAQGLSITIDDKPFATALVGIARPIDPGKHTFVAIAEGFGFQKSVVSFAERDHAKVELALQPDASAPAAGDDPGAAAGASDRPPAARSLKPFAFAAIGLGVVGLGVGAAFSIMASSKRGDADALYATCSPCSPNSQLAHDIEAADSAADTRRAIAAASLIGGGVFAAGGIAYLIFAPAQRPAASRAPGARLRVQPMIGVRSLGVTGAF